MKITVQMDIEIQTPCLIEIQTPCLASEALARSYIAGLFAPLKSHHLTAIRKLMMEPETSETCDRIAVHEVDQKNIETLLETLRVQVHNGDQ